jgi:AcrR family transcriptional regulator
MAVQADRGYAKGRAKRLQILAEATALFGEVGYRSASLREIAARCGISHPGLLHHFPSKELLLQAVLEHRDEADADRYERDHRAGEERLEHLIAITARNAGTPGIVELYAVLSAEASSPDHPAHAYFVDRYQRVRTWVTQTFELLAAQGRLVPGAEPAHLAIATIALMDGLQVQWLLDRTAVDMAAELRRFFASVVLDVDAAG